MTIEFKKHVPQSPDISQEFINFVYNFFHNLSFNGSYERNLQLMYNNGLHFQTVRFSLCSNGVINHLLNDIYNPNILFHVLGEVHENNHSSGVIVDENMNMVFVEDKYFKIMNMETREIHHLLVNPPKLHNPYLNYSFFYSDECDYPEQIIYPTI